MTKAGGDQVHGGLQRGARWAGDVLTGPGGEENGSPRDVVGFQHVVRINGHPRFSKLAYRLERGRVEPRLPMLRLRTSYHGWLP